MLATLVLCFVHNLYKVSWQAEHDLAMSSNATFVCASGPTAIALISDPAGAARNSGTSTPGLHWAGQTILTVSVAELRAKPQECPTLEGRQEVVSQCCLPRRRWPTR